MTRDENGYLVRDGASVCWCGAEIFNGHRCANGHMQSRTVSAPAVNEVEA